MGDLTDRMNAKLDSPAPAGRAATGTREADTPLSLWCAHAPHSAAKEIALLRRFIAKYCTAPIADPKDARVAEAARFWVALPVAADQPST